MTRRLESRIDRWSFWTRLTRRFLWVSKQILFNVMFSVVLFFFTALFMIGESFFNAPPKVAGPVATTAADTIQPMREVASTRAKPSEQAPTSPSSAMSAEVPKPLSPGKKAKGPSEGRRAPGMAEDSNWLRPGQFEVK